MSRPLLFVDDGEAPESYNVPFTMSELRFALALSYGLSYPFLRHLHPTALDFLLGFFNWMYVSELFPDLWNQSIARFFGISSLSGVSGGANITTPTGGTFIRVNEA